MAKPSILEISKRNDDFWFVLTPAGKPFSGAAEQGCPVRVSSSVIEAFCKKIKDAVDAANRNPLKPGINSEPFIEAGRGLFRMLLPETDPLARVLLEMLRRMRTPLLISTDDASIFWELLFDDASKSFLGLHFKAGRRLIRKGLPVALPRRRADWRWLVIANADMDEKEGLLRDAAKEAQWLKDWLGRKKVAHLDYLEGKEANFDTVLEALTRHEYDVIHYAGHTVLDRGEYALVLDGGRLFPASSIRRLVRGTPIVFLNGCWTGIAKGLGNAAGSAEGLVGAFLDAGAQLVVGSLFPASDTGARAFAEKFYEAVLAGKMVGEAMRLARQHVKAEPEYGAAWACFVMYGDPCLRFNLRKDPQREDPLPLLLDAVSLSRSDFEPSCLRVIQQAAEYGAGRRAVGTPHLFAAMVDGEDRRVRECLRRQSVPPEKLRDAFAEVFKVQSAAKKPSRWRLSDNAEEILKQAQTVARSQGRARISETDLIEGFVVRHGGTTSEILRALGADVREFLRDLRTDTSEEARNATRELSTGSTVAPRTRGDQSLLDQAVYSPGAWRALIRAIEVARASGSAVETRHLVWSMLQDAGGPVAKAFQRLGIHLTKKEFGINGEGLPAVPAPRLDIHMTSSVGQILTLARKAALAAQHKQVTEQDLLVGFVQQGGGSVGRALRVPLQLLLSELFLDSDGIDPKRLTPEARRALDAAQELGRQKSHQVIGRHHLLYGLLQDEKTLLHDRLQAQGVDVKRLTNLVFAKLPSKLRATSAVAGRGIIFSSGLVTILCAAEQEMKDRQECLISERQLARSLLEFGGEDIATLLVQNGVDLLELLAKLKD